MLVNASHLFCFVCVMATDGTVSHQYTPNKMHIRCRNWVTGGKHNSKFAVLLKEKTG